MADFNAGSIEASLTVDRDPFTKGLQEAKSQGEDFERKTYVAAAKVDNGQALEAFDDVQLRAEEVGELHPTVKVTADTKEADAALATTKKVAKDTADNGFSPLILAALALGPALVPLGAFAVAGAGAAVMTLGSLALAIKGAAVEMKAGTAVGLQYTAGVNTLKGALAELERTAATSALPAFNAGVKQATGLLPQLNLEVNQFAVIGGDIANNVLHGLIGGFITLEPLFIQLAVGAEKLSADFDKYANGGGLAKFQTWTAANLPTIEHDIGQIVGAVAKLTAAMGPMGLTSLNAFALITRAINALPLDVLKVLVPLVVDGYLAFKAYQGLDSLGTSILPKISTAFDKITTSIFASNAATEAATAQQATFAVSAAGEVTALDGVAAAAKGAAVAQDAASLSVGSLLGPIGGLAVGVGLLATTFFGSSSGTSAATKAMQTYTQAVKDDNGAIGDNIKSQLAQNLVNSKAIDSANALGISTQDLSSAILNGGAPLDALRQKLETMISTGTNLHQQQTTQVKDAQALLPIINAQNSGVAGSVSKYNELQSALSALGVTEGNAVGQTSKLNDAFVELEKQASIVGNTSAQDLQKAMDTFSKSAGTAADKSDLLGAVLKDSQGDLLSYAGAMAAGSAATKDLFSAFAQDQLNVKKGTEALGDTEKAAIDLTTGLIDTAKNGAGPLIQQLQGMQDAATKAAQATYQHELSTKGDKLALQDAQTVFESMTRDTLINNAKQLGLTTDQATKLANQYFAMPSDVSTDVQAIGLNDIDDTLNKIGELLAKLTGQQWVIPVSANVKTDQLKAVGSGSATAGHHATGGYIAGPGSATSDSIPEMLSNGEYVEPASVVARPGIRAMLESLRNGGATTRAMSASPASGNSSNSNQMALVVSQLTQLVNVTKDLPAQTGSEVSGQLKPVLARQSTADHLNALMRARAGAVGVNSDGS
jgi:hypothetical protein